MYYPIDKGTIIRTILMVVALINTILTLTGKNPLPYSNEEIEAAVTVILQVVATLWAWWKNNSFTMAARICDETMRHQKAKRKLYTKDS